MMEIDQKHEDEIDTTPNNEETGDDSALREACDKEGYITQLERKMVSLPLQEVKKYVDQSILENENDEVVESMIEHVRQGISLNESQRRKVIFEVRKVLPDVCNEVIMYKMRDLTGSESIILALSEPEMIEETLKEIEEDNKSNEVIPPPPPIAEEKKRHFCDDDYVPEESSDGERDEPKPQRKKKKKKPPKKKKKKRRYESDSDFEASSESEEVADEEEEDDDDKEEDPEESEEEEEEDVEDTLSIPPPPTPKKKKKSSNYNIDDDYVPLDAEEEEELRREEEERRTGKKRKRSRNDQKGKKKKKRKKGRIQYNDLDFSDQKNWSKARKRAWAKKHSNPNEFYYRFLSSDEEQRHGKFDRKERKLFMNKVKELNLPKRDDRNWGLFSKGFKGRVGYQCANFYRQQVEKGNIQDDHYEWVDGKLKMTNRVLYGNKTRRRRSGQRRGYVNDISDKEYDKKYMKMKSNYTPNYSLGGEGYVNPIPDVKDSITNEKMKNPMVSKQGYVLDKTTWRNHNRCPYTNIRLNRRKLVLLTEENILKFFNGEHGGRRSQFWGYSPIRVIDVEEYPGYLKEEYEKREK